MVDHVVWLPTNSPRSRVRAGLGAIAAIAGIGVLRLSWGRDHRSATLNTAGWALLGGGTVAEIYQRLYPDTNIVGVELDAAIVLAPAIGVPSVRAVQVRSTVPDARRVSMKARLSRVEITGPADQVAAVERAATDLRASGRIIGELVLTPGDGAGLSVTAELAETD